MKVAQKIYNIRSAMINQNLDVSTDDIAILRRCAMTLHRWCEAECNGEIQRDEKTGKPFRYYGQFMDHKTPTPDRETGALKRIKLICKDYNLFYHYQTDPRGCSLYISYEFINDLNYSSKGFAVGDFY